MTTRITAIRNLPVEQLRRHPGNVRDDLGDTDELAHSMVAQGVLQPILVAPRGQDLYVVLDGNRRLVAARTAGIRHLPCLITSEDSKQSTLATMLAAAMHKQLAPLEQARAFRDLAGAGLTVAQIAARTGYSQATVRDRLQLVHLPADAKDMLARREFTVAQATDLAKQVAKTGRGTTGTTTRKATYLDRDHRLAATVKARCNHRDTRVLVGGVGCGQCWEAAITTDAQERQTS